MPNNITPIRQQIAAPEQQDWWAHPEHPIWPPQGTCGPQPCPPRPSPPSCFSQVAKADACWDQSQALYNLVSKVVMDIFTKNPGIIPPPPPGASSNPIIGVSDGSNAQPGIVGEFIQGTSQQAYAGYPTSVQWTAQSPLIVPPGDWDLWAFISFSNAIGGAAFWLSPMPTGLSNAMAGQAYQTSAEAEYINIIGSMARGNFTVPTLLAFGGNINNSNTPSITGGTATMVVSGRRVR